MTADLFIVITLINICIWTRAISKSDDKFETVSFGAITWALCLGLATAIRCLFNSL